MSTVTIIGGHGKVALLTAPLLIDAGHTVRSVIRKEEQTEDVRATGAEPVVADIASLSEEELVKLFEGTGAVVWAAGAGGGDPEATWAIDRDAAIRTMDAAEKARVNRYVMVSYFGSRLEDGQVPGVSEDEGMYPYYNAKSQADEHLKNSQLDYTIVGPSALTLDEPTGMITVDNSGDTSDGDVPETSRANVARVIAAALDEPDAVNKTIFFHDGDAPIAQAVKTGN